MRSLAIATAAFLAVTSAGAEPRFAGLGDLADGSFASQGEGISADASVVVGSGVANGPRQAFRWTSDEGMVNLGSLPGGPGGNSEAFDASADGAVVVGYSDSAAGDFDAFRWDPVGGMASVGDLSGGSYFSYAEAVSADGSVVVGRSVSGSGVEAFRWTAGGEMVGLGDLAGGNFSSNAIAITPGGSTIVGNSWGSLAPNEVFRWTSGSGMESLGFHGHVKAISADASVIIGFRPSGFGGDEAFRWTANGGVVGLGDLPGGGFRSEAYDVSADGSVIVGTSLTDVGLEAFVWDPVHGMRRLESVLDGYGLDLTGWHLTGARGISSDGLTIVGYGINPDGGGEAWIAVLPEPTDGGLLGAALIALAAHRRTRCRVVARSTFSAGAA